MYDYVYIYNIIKSFIFCEIPVLVVRGLQLNREQLVFDD